MPFELSCFQLIKRAVLGERSVLHLCESWHTVRQSDFTHTQMMKDNPPFHNQTQLVSIFFFLPSRIIFVGHGVRARVLFWITHIIYFKSPSRWPRAFKIFFIPAAVPLTLKKMSRTPRAPQSSLTRVRPLLPKGHLGSSKEKTNTFLHLWSFGLKTASADQNQTPRRAGRVLCPGKTKQNSCHPPRLRHAFTRQDRVSYNPRSAFLPFKAFSLHTSLRWEEEKKLIGGLVNEWRRLSADLLSKSCRRAHFRLPPSTSSELILAFQQPHS